MKAGIKQTIYVFFGIFLTFLFRGCYEEVPLVEDDPCDNPNGVLSFDQVGGVLDIENRTLFFTLPDYSLTSYSPEVDFCAYNSVQMDGQNLVKGQVNDLGAVRVNHPYQITAESEDQQDTFNLIFTPFPLIHIVCDSVIKNEPKVPARMVIHYPDPSTGIPGILSFESITGIEFRGGSSQIFEKKSFGLELWDETSGQDYSASLLGMRYMEDWILDAMYIDPLRMRNKLSFELWEKISSPPSEDQRDRLFPGIECRMVELIINNRYHGIYNLNEKLDPNLLMYTEDQYEKGGVLYKAISWAGGATRFETYQSGPPNSSVWDGWEQIYPEHYFSWDALDELRKLVVTAEDSVFKSRIGTMIDLDNAVNYYLFINLLKAYDNAGKNTFLARYTDQSRFFIIPWDIEGSWGIMWDGSEVTTRGFVENQLFIRLSETNAGEFNVRVRSSWEQYRESIFSKDSLLLPINQYHHAMIESGALDRENKRWPAISLDPDLEYDYISAWIEARLQFLDGQLSD